MKFRLSAARVALLSVASGTLLIGAAGTAAAATPPYEPDPNLRGTLTFYDAAGSVKTGGLLTDAPFATYVVGTVAGQPQDLKATLYGYLPVNGQPTGAWSGEQMAGPTAYPDRTFPGPVGTTNAAVVKVTSFDYTIGNLTELYPNLAPTGDPYYGLYQLRVKTGPIGTDPQYQAADIFVDKAAGTWQQVYPEPATTTVPNAPTGVTATAGNQQATVRWTAPASNGGAAIDRYDVEATPAGGTPLSPTTVVAGSPPATSTTVTGLTDGTSYTFRVRAHNSVGDGAWSAPSAAVKPPGVVTGLTLTPVLTTTGTDRSPSLTARASWTLPVGASGARLCLGAAAATASTCAGFNVAAPTSTFTFSGLRAGTTYWVTAFAYGSTAVFGDPRSAYGYGTVASGTVNKALLYGQTYTLATKLTRVGSTYALGGQTVQLWQKPAGATTWALLVSPITASTGIASYAVKPGVNTTYQWRYPGSAALRQLATVSPNTAVTVAYVVTYGGVYKTAIVRNTTDYLYGIVSPTANGQYVYLQLGGSTSTLKTTTLKAAIAYQLLPNGKRGYGFKIAWRPTSPGTYYLRAYKPATATNTAGFGAAYRVIVS